MIRAAAAALFMALLVMPRTAFAGSPPPPPPTPRCGPCVGPPSPPTPVPTLGPSLNPTPVVVSVSLSPLKVRRGQWEKTIVKAEKNAVVTLAVHYHHASTVTFHGKVGSSGAYSKSWKIAANAPLGKASVQVDVKSQSPYRSSLSFTVVR